MPQINDEFIAKESPRAFRETHFRVRAVYPDGALSADNVITEHGNVKGGYIRDMYFGPPVVPALEGMGLLKWLIKDGQPVEQVAAVEPEAEITMYANAETIDAPAPASYYDDDDGIEATITLYSEAA